MLDLSILIPVLNESSRIPGLIEKIRNYPPNFKVIFCDGGSTDGSIELLESFQGEMNYDLQVRELKSPSVMATINIGLETVSSSHIMIHPVDVDATSLLLQISSMITPKGCTYMIPYKEYDSGHPILKVQELILNNIRVKLMGSFVWTNCPIIETKTLKKLTNKPPAGFLEDVLLSDDLARLGKSPLIIKTSVTVSSRRYQKDGTVGRFLGNIYIMLLFRLKLASIKKLKKMYLKK